MAVGDRGVEERIDAESFDAFCTRFHPRLVGTLGLHTGDASLAEDIAQEALVRAFGRWGEVSAARSPDAWVLRVAFNLSASWFRRRSVALRRGRLASVSDVHRDGDTALRLSLQEALGSLPARQRLAVVLRYFGDLPVADAALVMGCAEGTVRALTAQGIASLRARLTGLDLEWPDA